MEFPDLNDTDPEDDEIDENLHLRMSGVTWLVGKGGRMVKLEEDADLTQEVALLLGGADA